MTTEQNLQYYLKHLKECIDRFDKHEIGLKLLTNAYADYWRYYIGANVIPANSFGKTSIVKWKGYQNAAIPESVHELWKEEGKFVSGMGLIMGKVWHRPDLLEPQHFLVGIDADNQLAIDELLNHNGKTTTVEEFSKLTLIERYENTKDRLHFYVYTVGGQLRNKTSDKVDPNFDPSKLPTFEVKTTSKFLMYPSPNGNKQGVRRKILGTYDVAKLDHQKIIREMQNHIDGICKKYGLAYGKDSGGQIPIQELFKEDFVVYKDHNRHGAILRIMESLITRNKSIMSELEIIQLAKQWNDKHCSPPLDDREFQKQWHDASVFLKKNVEHFLGIEKVGDSKETKEAKRLEKERIKKEKLKQREDYVDELITEWNLKTMQDTDEIYYYEKNRGIFLPHAEHMIKSTLEEKFGYDDPTNPDSIPLTNNDIKEYLGHIHRRTYIDRNAFDPDIEWIGTQNCMVNLLTGESREFNPEFLCTVSLPVRFDDSPETRKTQLAECAILGSAAIGSCPRIMKFLYDVMSPEDVETVLDFIAYCLWRHYKFAIWILFNGAGQNGKSTLINLITKFLGGDNVSSESLHRLLENRFAVAQLYRMLANVDADLSSETLRNTGILKKLTGNDEMPAEIKFLTPFKIRSHAKLIFSCNTMPETKDTTDAYFRRLVIINFNKQFFGKTDDVNLLQKLTTPEELSGLFRVVLSRLPRVLKNGIRTTSNRTMTTTYEKYIGNIDPAELFHEKALNKSGNPDDTPTKYEVYESYKLFCRVHNLIAGSEAYLSRKITSKGIKYFVGGRDQETGERPYRWYGLKLIDWKATDDIAHEMFDMRDYFDSDKEDMK
jgi:putative DNA primase/helicase